MLTAKDVMQTELATVSPVTSLTRFARMCAEDNISGCPVVGVDGRLLGIVTKTDLLDRLLAGQEYHGILGLGAEGVTTAEAEEEAYGQVNEIMETEVVTVAPDTPIADVARLMASERIHRVLVIENDRLVGLISSLDLLGRMAEL